MSPTQQRQIYLAPELWLFATKFGPDGWLVSRVLGSPTEQREVNFLGEYSDDEIPLLAERCLFRYLMGASAND